MNKEKLILLRDYCIGWLSIACCVVIGVYFGVCIITELAKLKKFLAAFL